MNQKQNSEQLATLKCQNHHLEIIMINIDEDNNIENRFLCALCLNNIQNKETLISLNDANLLIKQKYEIINDKLGLKINKYKIIINKIQNQLKQLNQIFNNSFRNIENDLQNWENVLIEATQVNTLDIIQEINYLIKRFNKPSDNELSELEQLINQYQYIYLSNINKQIIEIYKQFQEFKEVILIEQTKSNQNNMQNYAIAQFEACSIKKIDKIYQQETCFTIAFNNNYSLMAAGCNNQIKIYQIYQDKFELIKTLKGHVGKITCLLFSKYEEWLISGEANTESQIKLWKQDNSLEWIIGQVGNKHKNCIACLLMNRQENLLFSSGNEDKINIWFISYTLNTIDFQYQLMGHKQWIWQISLNENESNLISVSIDKTIIVWNKQEDQRYYFQQQINNDNFGLRLTFIDKNQFIWLDNYKGLVQTFIKEENGQFIQNNQLELDDNSYDNEGLFPCIYNESLQILFLKHNCHIYLLKKEISGKLLILQSLSYKTSQIYGGISNNGKIMAIWNETSKELILYKLKYL